MLCGRSRVRAPDRMNIQGPKINEQNVLPWYNIFKRLDIIVFSDKDYKP